MNRICGVLALVIISSAGEAGAADLQSGLQVGDYADAFYVTDVTGPSAGERLCYKCQYGARPVVSIFSRRMDDDVKKLIKQIDDVVGQHYDEERMAAFVVLLTDQPKQHRKMLIDTAIEQKLRNTPLTIYRKSTGPGKYRIHEDADVTVLMWVDSDVKSNHSFAQGKLTEDGIKQVVAATAKILE